MGAGHDDESGFGHKTIGTFGSMCLLTNNVTGPGLVMLCAVYQSCGWLLATSSLVVCCVVSTLCCLFLCEAMATEHGNGQFESRVEFTSLLRHTLPRWLYVTALLIFLFNLQSTIMASIVQSSQTADETLLALFGKTCALQLFPLDDAGFLCIDTDADNNSPFGPSWVVSIGFVAVLLVTLPFGHLNLDENTFVQVGSFYGLVVVVVVWCLQFLVMPWDWSNLPTTSTDTSGLVGNVLFNFAYITTIPSWVNEKHPDVSLQGCVWASTALGTLMFVCVGFLGALAYKFGDLDLLSVLADDKDAFLLTKVCVYVFPVLVLLASIPIFEIIVRYNLLESGLCSLRWANFWATVVPWLGALLFYSGDLLNDIVNWTGLLTAAPLNFLFPCYLFLYSRRRARKQRGRHEDQDAGGKADEARQRRHAESHPLLQPLSGSHEGRYGSGNGAAHGHAADGLGRYERFRALPDGWPAEWLACAVFVCVVIVNVVAIVAELWN